MRATTALNKTLTCLTIAAAVLVSGTHAKELATFTLPALWIDSQKQSDDPQQHIVKVASESLHDHTDKSAKVQTTFGDSQQADHRSLRLLGERKKQGPTLHVTDRIRLWWSLNTLWLT